LSDYAGRTVVLAFLADGALDAPSEEHLQTIRAELRGLGAVLTAVSPRGLWGLSPDDETTFMRDRGGERLHPRR
jgi:hypothetical protein